MPHRPVMYAAGRILPMDEATVSAQDAGLLLGAGLFETLRTYGGRPFRLAAHLARLRASGAFFHIAVRESDAEVADLVRRLVEANGVPDARVRITATRGRGEKDSRCLFPEGPEGCCAEKTSGVFFAPDSPPPATLLVTAGPMTPYPAELYERGATVILSEVRTSETDPTVYHKTTGYLRNLVALRAARAARATEALRFNTRDRLAEGAVSNVFLVREGRLLTPPVEDGLLAGVTRAAVLELAAGAGVPAEQRSLVLQDLLDADEVFLTNSIMEVLPVGRIERREVGQGKPGPVAGRLARAYRDLVARETRP